MAQELEMKILTDEAEFARCLKWLQREVPGTEDRYVQVNYYFDTPELSLASSHSMLRVRCKKDLLYLQYKNKRKRVESMLLCEEQEVLLPHFPRTVNPARYFPDAPDEDCRLLGDLVTYRIDFNFPDAVVSLDESIYFGNRDYEIEIEGDAHGIHAIASRLNPQPRHASQPRDQSQLRDASQPQDASQSRDASHFQDASQFRDASQHQDAPQPRDVLASGNEGKYFRFLRAYKNYFGSPPKENRYECSG